MSHKVLHCQRYLYPCQLSAVYHDVSENSKYDEGKNSFAFYSPLESHMSIYNVERDEHELIDLEGRRFMSMENVEQRGRQLNGSVILSNNKQIMIVGESQFEQKIVLRQNVEKNEEIISNALIIGGQNIQNLQRKLIYLTRNEINGLTEFKIQNFAAFNPVLEYQLEFDRSSQDEETVIISSSKSIDNRIRSGSSITNPQDKIKSYKSINSQDRSSATSLKCITKYCPNHEQSTNKLNYLPISSNKISMHTLSSQQGQHENMFRLYHSQKSLSQLLILDKQSSNVSLFDLQYGTVTDAILCSGYQDSINLNPHILHSQGRKLSILSDNLLLQYDSMGLIKLVDKRIGRTVQVRNLNEELAGLRNEIGQHSFQQHFIKYWNTQYQHTQQENLSLSTEFMINFHNKILNVDLRYKLNSLNYSQLFSAESDQILGNYHIKKQKDCNIIGFTTENHNSFKSYVVEEHP